ncbi:AAA family ATPase [Nocardia goodfellowii]
MITTLAVENYRSLRHLVIPLAQLNVVTGANGSGKSSLYRSLRLLVDVAGNNIVRALAREGGLESTLWAGPAVVKRNQGRGNAIAVGQYVDSIAMRLGFSGDDFGYSIELGVPTPDMATRTENSLFNHDPEIKRESIWAGRVLRPSTTLVERHNSAVNVRAADGEWETKPHFVHNYDSMLSELADPEATPELFRVRERIRSWRFYDHFRTDAEAPARGSQIGTRTFVLSGDGADLAAALRTIYEVGDRFALAKAIDHAFPGSRLEVTQIGGRLQLLLHQPGLDRPLSASELSDGTLRYLLLIAALLTPRPPELLVLNEPEASLHPDLIAPLAALIADAAQNSQIIVVSHSRSLVTAAVETADSAGVDATLIQLVKGESGESLVDGQGILDSPAWHWPKR